jgi:Rrf2 family protein
MLSMKGKYGLRACMVMAERPEEFRQARALADSADVPLRFLEAILLELRRAGLIETRRGAQGGYRLARPPSEITAGAVIRVLEGMLAPIPCASHYRYAPCEDCRDPMTCGIRSLMLDVRNEIAGVLDRRSLAELVPEIGGGPDDPA